MEVLKNTLINAITVVTKYPYANGLVYDKYVNGRGCCGIVVIISGELEFEFSDGHTVILKNGDIALFSEKSAYKVKNNFGKDVMHYSVNFSCVNSSLFEKETYFICADFRKITELCNRIYQFWCASDAISKIRGLSNLYELIATLFEERLRSNIGNIDYERIFSLKKYIDEHYSDKLDLELLAAKSMMSKTNFRRLFKKMYSVSPIEYLIRFRLSRAAEMITTSALDISEIASKCGFTRTAYFCELFKNRTGYTPGAIRKAGLVLEDILKIISEGEMPDV